MMTESGLEEWQTSPAFFLFGEDKEETEESVTAEKTIYEGSRPVMFKVQALVTPRQHRIHEKDCQ